MLPYCLLFHKTLPDIIFAKLKTYVTPVFVDEPVSAEIYDKITVATVSPMIGFDSAWFDKLPNLKLIAVFGVGTDKVDLVEARKRGINVTTTLDILTEDVTDMALALLLAAARKIVIGDQFVRNHKWAKGETFGLSTSVRGKKLGIVGLGAIGRDIAHRSEAFGMIPSYYNRTQKPDVSWSYYNNVVELAKDNDILVIAISATPQTEKIINSAVLQALGPKGILINIARGAVIDENALIEALQTGIIASAGLDVFLNEPNIDERFLKIHNAVLVPHQASATHETREAMGQCVIDNIVAVLNGNAALTIVN